MPILASGRRNRAASRGGWIHIDGANQRRLAQRSLDELRRAPDVQVMPWPLCVGCYDHKS